MLDPKIFRHHLDELATHLAKRNFTLDSAVFTAFEQERKSLQTETETLQSQRNQLAKTIGQKKSKGESTDELLKEAASISEKLTENEKNLASLLRSIEVAQQSIPNILDESVPQGRDEKDNVVIRTVGKPTAFDFSPKDHVDLTVPKGLADFDRAALVAASRFVYLFGPLARLHRALIQFMLDTHTQEHGYQEVYAPYLVNANSLFGTGQLPKFEEDVFKTTFDPPLYLIPTAEVSVTNLGRDRIFSETQIPAKWVCHTPCFRSEAGSYGRDTRGMIRQHQFEKVELVQLVPPEASTQAHEALTLDAERILQKLQLPYRTVLLCSGDTGFCSSKTYDLEVWLPSQKTYREISSCSNFKDYQTRRMQARWRNPLTNKSELLHSLNGSGLAVGRTLVAVLENYQRADGSIRIPDVLMPYMKTEQISLS